MIARAAWQRMKDMLAELNQMLEQRERGEEPDFDGFMERYGDFFPGNPQTLDELLEQMAQLDGADAAAAQLDDARAARAAPGARRTSLLEDMDLRWQVDQLGQQPAAARSRRWAGASGMRLPRRRAAAARPDGARCSTSSATSTRSRTCCATRPSPGQLAEVDLDQARELLGDDAARSLEQLARARARCSRRPGSSSSAKAASSSRPRASARIGQQALGDLFRKLLQDRAGRHEIERAGFGHERAVRAQALRVRRPVPPRRRADGARTRSRRQGAGTPVRLSPDDFEVERTEQLTRSRDRADARRVALDADARQLPRRPRRSRWRCTR